jgi:hypothetical protein
MTINVRSAQDNRAPRGTANSAGRGAPALQARAANLQQRVAVLTIAVSAVIHLLRDRRFQTNVITLAIGAAALAGLAREGQTRSLSRLATWYRQQTLRDLPMAKARQT